MYQSGIEQFDHLVNNLEDGTLNLIDSNGALTVTFQLNEAAQQAEIEQIETSLQMTLPKSYKAFLQKYNGGTIYNYNDLGGFEILGTNEIISYTNQMKGVYEEDWADHLLVFATCIGEGDFLSFSCDHKRVEFSVVDCSHDELPREWNVIADSFDEWLKGIIANQGEKYWLNME